MSAPSHVVGGVVVTALRYYRALALVLRQRRREPSKWIHMTCGNRRGLEGANMYLILVLTPTKHGARQR